MAYIPKYRKGAKITSLDQVMRAFKEGQWLWLNQSFGKHLAKHPSIIISMTLITVMRFIDAGMLYYAEETEK